MEEFPLKYIAPVVETEKEGTRMVPSVTLHGHGRISRIKVENTPLKKDIPDGRVEVQVEYCGMNFMDNYLRLGIIRNHRFPVIMGSECCGVITRIGFGVKDLQVGQRVLCLVMMGGLFRRMVHVPWRNCFVVPDGVDLKDAIGLGLNYLVAYNCLFDLGALKPDDVVFMHSIAGGVGTAVTQLSQTVHNVKILGTASDSKFEELTSHGVEKVYHHYEDYVQEVLKQYPEGVDIIINSYGGPDIEHCFKMLKRCGTLILIGSNCNVLYPRTARWGMFRPSWDAQTVSSADLISKSYIVAGVSMGSFLDNRPEITKTMMAEIFNLFLSGKIKPRIHAVLPFEKIADGMTQLCERKNFGKIILELEQEAIASDEPDASAANAEETQQPAPGESSQAAAEAKSGDKPEPKHEAEEPAAAAVEPPAAKEAAAAGTPEAKKAGDAQPPKQAEEKTAEEPPKTAIGPQ